MYNGIIVDLIKDFTSGTNLTLHSFKDTKQSSEDTDLEYKEYTYDDVLYLINRYKFLYDRVFVFPASLFKIRKPDRSYRSNYAEMFSDLSINSIFEESVILFKSSFSYRDVFKLICDVVSTIPLEVKYCRFYVEIVTLRYLCIVLRMNFDEAYSMVERMCNDNYVI